MRYDGGNALKYQDHCAGLRALPLNQVECESDIGQMNEVLCKVLCHNLCVLIQAIHELGIDATFEKNHNKSIENL
jgi:hypothetical protein